jgi:hypothetical protein
MNAMSMVRVGRERTERVERRRETQLDAVGEPGPLPCPPGDGGPVLADVAAQQPAAGLSARAMQIDE